MIRFHSTHRSFPYEDLSSSFNIAMRQIGSNLSFGSDGLVISYKGETKTDLRIISFWYACLRVIDNLNSLKLVSSKGKISGKRSFPKWIITQHPNIIWGKKARKALTHVHRFSEREQWDAIPGVIVSLFENQTSESITVGRRLSVDEYAELWLDTIAYSIYTIGEHLRPGQLQTWIGVDIDGSDADFINYKKIKAVCARFMRWTMRQYQGFIVHYQGENPNLVDQMNDSLEATKSGTYESNKRPNAYRSPEEFISDLRKLIPSLYENDKVKVRTFIKKVRTLGFTTLQFQPRINSSSVWATLEEIASINGIKGDRKKILEGLLRASNIDLLNLKEDVAVWVLDVMNGYKEVLLRTNRLDEAVLANCQSALDIKAARLLFSLLGMPEISIIDLKEDAEGMNLSNVRRCAAESQSVSMCGCSDTPRNLGYVGGIHALMEGFQAIVQAGKQAFYGRAFHPARGGGNLQDFLEVMGAPEEFYSLIQGDDVFFACISPESALDTFVPRLRRDESKKSPKILDVVARGATSEFRKLVEDKGFNRFWDSISSLTRELVISARPASRSSNGSSGGSGWEASRAIGVVQTSVAVMAYYPHLYGASSALSKYSKSLARLYKAKNPHVCFLIEGIKTLLKDVDISHFREVAEDKLSKSLIEEISRDFWALRAAIREIEGTQEFKMHDAPASVQRARATVREFLKERGDGNMPVSPLLNGALHLLLSFARTSG